jgi:hypothetical protein
VPVRVFFSRDGRKPGFFELDTVARCGTNSRGDFCATLTVTGVYSGWTEEVSLRAHRWVKEAVAALKTALPFPILGIDSGNGGEFINKQLIDWCAGNGVQFTRGRPYRKNDNCFAEQKKTAALSAKLSGTTATTPMPNKPPWPGPAGICAP